jgi:hypothetical protein
MPADISDSVFKAIDARRDEFVELTRQLIRFPTVNPPAARDRMRTTALRCIALLLTLSVVSLASGAGAEGSATIGMQLEPPILDPTANPAAAISEALYGNVFEGLLQFAADGSVLPQHEYTRALLAATPRIARRLGATAPAETG